METAGQVGSQAGADAGEVLGATFWETDKVSWKNFKNFSKFGKPKKIVTSGGKGGTFFFVPMPLYLAFAVWQSGWARRLPIFKYWISTEILKAPPQDIFYKLWKYELRISMVDKKIFVPDGFAHWLQIPWALNDFEAPSAMTVRRELHVEKENLREIVVLTNGRVYLPKK